MADLPPACRRCGHTGRGLVASLARGEHVCASIRACERRQQAALRSTNHGGWGTSPKWPRKITATTEARRG